MKGTYELAGLSFGFKGSDHPSDGSIAPVVRSAMACIP
jgi:hypothetical protein